MTSMQLRIIPVLLLCTAAVATAGCNAVFGGSNPTPTATAVPPTPTPSAPDLTVFRNFSYPVAGGCLPEGDQLMPNAPREYRKGIHEGVDFYGVDNCTAISTQSSPVRCWMVARRVKPSFGTVVLSPVVSRAS